MVVLKSDEAAKGVATRCPAANPTLLNSSFEGYKLSLDSVPVQKISFNVIDVKPSTSQWAFQYSAVFSSSNLLFDAGNFAACFSIDADRNLVCFYRRNGKLTICKMCNLSPAAASGEPVLETEKLPPSMTPVADDCLAVCDGGSTIYLFQEVPRGGGGFEAMDSPSRLQLPPSDTGYILRAAYAWHYPEKTVVKVLAQTIVQHSAPADSTAGSHYASTLHIVAFARPRTLPPTLTLGEWSVESDEVLNLSQGGRILFAEFCEYDQKLLHVLTEGGFLSFEKGDEEAGNEPSEKQDRYAWAQDEEFIYVMVTIPSGTEVASVDGLVWHLEATSLGLSTRDEVVLLGGQLPKAVIPNDSGISLLENKIEIKLKKASNEEWPELLVGDGSGQQVSSLSDWVTTDNLDPSAGQNSSLYGREECDATADSFLHSIRYLDKKITKADVSGHQFLFGRSIPVRTGTSHFICLRYDVDGLLFEPSRKGILEDEFPGHSGAYEHVDTFDALGFVAAGKPSRKFTTCSPSRRYAVVADTHRHVYVYWKAGLTGGHELRNRKTGKLNQVARQQVLTVGGNAILGVCALDSQLFVLTDEEVLMFDMENTELE